MRHGRITTRLVFAALAIAMGVASCAKPPVRALTSEHSYASPAVRGADRGLELWWWVVTDPRPERSAAGDEGGELVRPGEKQHALTVTQAGDPLERVLAPYLSRPTPVPDQVKALWKAHGLRVVSVPLKDLEKVQLSLRLTGPVHRQWFGEISDWTDVVRGPEFDSPKVVMFGDRPEELRPGRLRLLARCWVYPIASPSGGSPGAGLRVELVPEYEPAMSERPKLQIAAALTGEDTSGMYHALKAGLSMEKSASATVRVPGTTLAEDVDALVIVPDAPHVDWRKVASGQQDESEGPPVDYPQTMGEAMLSVPPARAQGGVAPRARAVVILIPRIPERFELLGR